MSRRVVELLVLAELNPDVVVGCATSSVAFGQAEQLVERAVITLGSSGAITASAAAALGVPVGMVAVVGADEAGRLADRMLAERGVDTSHVIVRAGRPTGMTVVLSAPDGDRALLTATGTMADLTVDDVRPCIPAGIRHVHVSSVHLQRGLLRGLPELFDELRSAGVTISIDPGWDPAEDWTATLPLLGHIDHLLPNAAEATAIARHCPGSGPVEDAETAAARLAALVPVVLVKDGARGAVLATGGRVTRVAAPAVEVLDTTGAGDNADAGFLVALLAGHDPATAAAAAVTCGSIAVQGWGGTGRHATFAEAFDAVPAAHPALATKE